MEGLLLRTKHLSVRRTHAGKWLCNGTISSWNHVVEAGGIEPPCWDDRLGLLRAYPALDLASGLPQAGGALGQPGFDVRLRPPGGTAAVSLLMTSDPGPQAIPGGRLLSD
jgi:hypothetical protein